MDLKDFYYDLPKELIAQDALLQRDSARLMTLHRHSDRMEHRVFSDITDYIRPNDCLVLNNTKVIPARLHGKREDTGASVELLLLKRREKDIWETLVKPGKKARVGTKLLFGDGLLRGEIVDIVEEGNRLEPEHLRQYAVEYSKKDAGRDLHSLFAVLRIQNGERQNCHRPTGGQNCSEDIRGLSGRLQYGGDRG